jgi:hypothetical protein
MSLTTKYFDFIKLYGKSLTEINPGSDEYALEVDDAFQAIELLRGSQTPILGGDILSVKSDALIYAYQLWGSQYHCLNWSCEKGTDSQEEYCERSYKLAMEAIDIANKTADKLGKKCYITLVV